MQQITSVPNKKMIQDEGHKSVRVSLVGFANGLNNSRRATIVQRQVALYQHPFTIQAMSLFLLLPHLLNNIGLV